MKKTLFLIPVVLLLTSCTTSTPEKPAEPTLPASSVKSGVTVPTGSGYDDKEVQETMKEIDSILSDTVDTGATKK
jgi:hypothetical protein